MTGVDFAEVVVFSYKHMFVWYVMILMTLVGWLFVVGCWLSLQIGLDRLPYALLCTNKH